MSVHSECWEGSRAAVCFLKCRLWGIVVLMCMKINIFKVLYVGKDEFTKKSTLYTLLIMSTILVDPLENLSNVNAKSCESSNFFQIVAEMHIKKELLVAKMFVLSLFLVCITKCQTFR